MTNHDPPIGRVLDPVGRRHGDACCRDRLVEAIFEVEIGVEQRRRRLDPDDERVVPGGVAGGEQPRVP